MDIEQPQDHQKIFNRLAQRFSKKIKTSIDSEDRRTLKDFLSVSFGKSSIQHSDKYSKWLFEYNNINKQYIAWDKESIIGCQTELSCLIETGNKELKGAWAIDLSVRKDWQMKGLGVALIKQVMDNNEIAIGLGISSSAQAMFQRLNWQTLGRVNCFLKPLSSKGFSSSMQNNKLKSLVLYPIFAWGFRIFTKIKQLRPSPYHILDISSTPNYFKDLQVLFEKHPLKKGMFRLKRSAEHFNWRFIECPFNPKYKVSFLYKDKNLESYVICKTAQWKDKKVLAICDYFGEERSYPHLIRHCEKLALDAQVDAIMYQGINPNFEKKLKSSFFVERPHGDLFMLFLNEKARSSLDLQDINNWNITFSDSDMDFMFFQT